MNWIIVDKLQKEAEIKPRKWTRKIPVEMTVAIKKTQLMIVLPNLPGWSRLPPIVDTSRWRAKRSQLATICYLPTEWSRTLLPTY